MTILTAIKSQIFVMPVLGDPRKSGPNLSICKTASGSSFSVAGMKSSGPLKNQSANFLAGFILVSMALIMGHNFKKNCVQSLGLLNLYN